jgi:hypothetical protein
LVLLESRMSKKPSQIVQVKVRMREDLRRKIEHAAQKNGLTVNAEILRRLDQTFDATFDKIDKLEGSVATLTSRIDEVPSRVDDFLLERFKRFWEESQRRLTEAEKKDQGDQS